MNQNPRAAMNDYPKKNLKDQHQASDYPTPHGRTSDYPIPRGQTSDYTKPHGRTSDYPKPRGQTSDYQTPHGSYGIKKEKSSQRGKEKQTTKFHSTAGIMLTMSFHFLWIVVFIYIGVYTSQLSRKLESSIQASEKLKAKVESLKRCADEDEANPLETGPCPFPGMFVCGSIVPTCHKAEDRCDGVQDCGDGDLTDEMNCDNFVCVDKQFKCDNGKCKPILWRCDNKDDCGDGSDENAKICQATGPCENSEFECANGYDVFNVESDKCIKSQNLCDDTSDCSDGSDEADELCSSP